MEQVRDWISQLVGEQQVARARVGRKSLPGAQLVVALCCLLRSSSLSPGRGLEATLVGQLKRGGGAALQV